MIGVLFLIIFTIIIGVILWLDYRKHNKEIANKVRDYIQDEITDFFREGD